MARNRLFWSDIDHDTTLRRARRSGVWRIGRLELGIRGATDEMGALPTGHAVGIPGAAYQPAEQAHDTALVQVQGARIELDGPLYPVLDEP
jgi:hypothetical protein